MDAKKSEHPVKLTQADRVQVIERAAKVLTASKYAFTLAELQEVATYVGTYADLDPADVPELLKESRLVKLGGAKNKDYYSTREAVEREQNIIRMWNDGRGHARAKADEAVARRELAATTARNKVTLKLEQEAGIVRVLTASDDTVIINGSAGTGKTFMTAQLAECAESLGIEVRGTAYTGKAKSGLADEAHIDTKTLDGLMMSCEIRACKASGRDLPDYANIDLGTHSYNFEGLPAPSASEKPVILVCDEAGMADDVKIEALQRLAKSQHWKLVLMGDVEQFAPIGAGSPMAMLMQLGADTARMTDIRRQQDERDRQAAKEFVREYGTVENAMNIWKERGYVAEVPAGTDRMNQCASEYLADERAAKSKIVLTGTNARAKAYNAKIIAGLCEAGALPEKGVTVKCEAPTRENRKATEARTFRSGQRIMFTKNSEPLGVSNGSMATIDTITDKRMTATLDNGQRVDIDLAEYTAITHGYCITNMKAQGISCPSVYLDIGARERTTCRAALYVGGSRHREQLRLFTDDVAELVKTTSAEADKVTAADFPEREAAAREQEQRTSVESRTRLGNLEYWARGRRARKRLYRATVGKPIKGIRRISASWGNRIVTRWRAWTTYAAATSADAGEVLPVSANPAGTRKVNSRGKSQAARPVSLPTVSEVGGTAKIGGGIPCAVRRGPAGLLRGVCIDSDAVHRMRNRAPKGR